MYLTISVFHVCLLFSLSLSCHSFFFFSFFQEEAESKAIKDKRNTALVNSPQRDTFQIASSPKSKRSQSIAIGGSHFPQQHGKTRTQHSSSLSAQRNFQKRENIAPLRHPSFPVPLLTIDDRNEQSNINDNNRNKPFSVPSYNRNEAISTTNPSTRGANLSLVDETDDVESRKRKYQKKKRRRATTIDKDELKEALLTPAERKAKEEEDGRVGDDDDDDYDDYEYDEETRGGKWYDSLRAMISSLCSCSCFRLQEEEVAQVRGGFWGKRESHQRQAAMHQM